MKSKITFSAPVEVRNSFADKKVAKSLQLDDN